ncbi:MAG: carboxylating nicotinate-nucleotide diphosphorylase [Bacteroidales bacterium]|nr:carboxylating nicotinate-nucleotide diphosphorylase [Bacteroidales bacterium]
MADHFKSQLNKIIDIWLEEDIGDGDHTTLSTIPESAMGKARLLVKQDGIIAGVRVAIEIFKRFDKKMSVRVFIEDGSPIEAGQIVFEVSGSVHSILQTERLVLNVMQRMSGVATQTGNYVKKLEGLKTKILDTRKTSPSMRMLEKEAVKLGGGENHRFGLYDMILIKDNHIDFAGGISQALDWTRKYLTKHKKDLKIEIEARSLDDIREILTTGHVDRILLDNFSPELTSEAVKLINGQCETESSGGITIDNIRDYAECGVDYISVGALTHQIKSLDLSLKAAF